MTIIIKRSTLDDRTLTHPQTHTHTFTVSLNVKENLYTTTTTNRVCCNVSLCIQKKEVSALHQLALAFIFIDISYTKKKKENVM